MRLLHPLFALLGASTDAQLARMIEYLKAENRVLRDKLPKRITVTAQERGRKRGEGTWYDFLTRHAATLWAADFLSVKTWTVAGLVDLYLLVFIHIGTRRVIISNPTISPCGEWVTQQARNATMTMDDWG